MVTVELVRDRLLGHAPRRSWSAVVRELQGDAEVGLLEQADHVLQVVLLLARHPALAALDLRLNALRALIADLLADRLRLVGVDALDDLAVDLERLARRPGVTGVQGLQRDAALDQLLLEYVQRRPHPLLGVGRQRDGFLATAPRDR